MFPGIAKRLDQIAIETACRSVRGPEGVPQSGEGARHPEYFADPARAVRLEFGEGNSFRFASPVESPWPENNVVSGRLFRHRGAGRGGEKGPVVLLLHGWNGERGYRSLFPLLAWRFRRLGLTVAMMELPYHGSRKPRSGRLRNFLSGDIGHMMDATRQAIADIRALVRWLDAEGYGPIGLWGVSLGAWLGGLVTSVEERLGAAVFVTPVPKLEEAIETLAFCRHIRASMEGSELSAADLNLTAHRPKLPPERLLIVESVYDLFASRESIEELWQAWDRPERWQVEHGHISVLFSIPIMNRTGRWLQKQLHTDPFPSITNPKSEI